MDDLAKLIVGRWRAAAAYRRRPGFDKMLSIDTWQHKAFRAYRRIHEPEEQEAFPGMSFYMPVVKYKVDGTMAAVADLIAPVIDAPFSMTATPIPTLNESSRERAKTMIREQLSRVLADNGLTPSDVLTQQTWLGATTVDPSVEQWIETKAKELRQTMLAMQKRMAQQSMKLAQEVMRDMFIEGQWRAQFARFLLAGMRDMAGFIRGPDLRAVPVTAWNGDKFERKIDVIPTFRVIEYADAYPSDDASNANDGQGFTETVLMKQEDILALLADDRYNKEVIKEIFQSHPEQRMEWWDAFTDRYGQWAGWPETPPPTVRLIHQGKFSGRELSKYGVTGYEPTQVVDVEVEIMAGRVIRIEDKLSPKGNRTVYSASYRSDGGSVYGQSIGSMLHDSQRRINRLYYLSTRAAMQQAGAMYFYDPDIVVNKEINFQPFALNMANLKRMQGIDPLRSMQPAPTYHSLREEMMHEIRMTDQIAGVSVIMHDAMPSGPQLRSATGVTILYATAAKQLKNYLFNIDTYVLPPLLQNLYAHVMETRKDLRDGADAKVGSVGLNQLMNKEIQEARLFEAFQVIAAAANTGKLPEKLVAEAYRKMAESLGLSVDEFMPDVGASQEIDQAVGQSTPQTPIALPGNVPVDPSVLPGNVTLGNAPAQTIM